MGRLRALAFLAFLTSCATAPVAEAPRSPASARYDDKQGNCVIVVENSLHTGEVRRSRYAVRVKSREECIRAADPHRRNFYPPAFRSKRVGFKWRGEK
jgi:hypothetical protein